MYHQTRWTKAIQLDQWSSWLASGFSGGKTETLDVFALGLPDTTSSREAVLLFT